MKLIRIVSDLWENDLMKETQMEAQKKNYATGIFDKYKIEGNLDLWEGFPEMMWAMGYEMDCENSFIKYRERSNLKLKEAHSERRKAKHFKPS